MGYARTSIWFLVVVLICLVNCVKRTVFLDVCSNDGTFLNTEFNNEKFNYRTNQPRNEVFHQEWFMWGRLYSFCMQYNSSTTGAESIIDNDCSSNVCKECMKACSSPYPFDLKNCNSSCTTNECHSGCSFYDTMVNNSTSPVTSSFDGNNQPNVQIAQKVQIISRSISDISFGWQPILSKTNPSLSSIYLVVLFVNASDQLPNIKNVLGLTTATNVSITLPEICSSFGTYARYEDKAKYKLFVYTINFNGYHDNIFDSEFTTPIAAPSVNDMSFVNPTYLSPKLVFGPKIRYDVTWISPANLSNTLSPKLKFYLEFITCTNSRNKRYWSTRTSTFKNNNEKEISMMQNSNQIELTNTVEDLLATCSFKVKITTRLDNCIAGQSVTATLLYEGCQTVPNYVCPVITTAPPILTDLPPTNMVFNENGYCGKYVNIICEINKANVSCSKCLYMTYNISVQWTTPQTGAPIKKYIIRWAEVIEIFPVEVGREILADINATSFYIPDMINITSDIEYEIKVLAITDITTELRPFNKENVIRKTLEGPDDPSPTTPNPTGASSSSGDNADSILIGILIPLILIILLFILYIWRRNRKIKGNFFGPEIIGIDLPEVKTHLKRDKWEIFPTSLTLDEKVGEGAFGTVFSAHIDAVIFTHSPYALSYGTALLMGDKSPKVAVKLLKDGASSMEFNDFKEEIALMKDIGYHKHIVNLIGCSTMKTPMCLIVEFMAGGDLLHFLRERRTKLCAANTGGEVAQEFMYTQQFQDNLHSQTSTSELVVQDFHDIPGESDVLTPDNLLSFAWQISSGMEYLETCNLVHRDLACRNILVAADKTVKISDFGLTRAMGSDLIYASNKNRKLPVKWMSVEAIFDQVFTTFSDVWAYGVVLFEIVTLGGTPYPGVNNRELLGLLKTGYRMEKPDNCAEPVYDIMLHCWNEDPLQRPTFVELKNHLEDIISQGDNYLSFDINEENTYYNVASFKSVSSENEDNDIEEEFMNKPMQIKTVEDLKKENDRSKENAKESIKEEKVKPEDPLKVKKEERYIDLKTLEPCNSIDKSITSAYINGDFNRSVVL